MSSENTRIGVSSLMDTWILLKEIDSLGERNRVLSIIKSRGMAHSNQIREFLLSESGIELIDVYTGSAGVLTGTARVLQETREAAEALQAERLLQKQQRELERRRQVTEAKIANLRMQLEVDEDLIQQTRHEHESRQEKDSRTRRTMARLRMADTQVKQ